MANPNQFHRHDEVVDKDRAEALRIATGGMIGNFAVQPSC